MTQTLLLLAEFSFELGLIGVDEYAERVHVARWLDDDNASSMDPREPACGRLEGEESQNDPSEIQIRRIATSPDSDWLELLLLGKWVFTRSDPDPYPSTPHGHLHNENRPWPKLNPYTGRAFKAKHQEEATMRLTKKEMRMLWRTQAFRDFCRSHILWYIEAHPHHAFRVPRPLRFPRW